MVNHAQEFVEIGILLKPFGIKGALKVHFYIDDPSDLNNVKEFYVYQRNKVNDYQLLRFKSIHFDKNGQFAKVFFEGIVDRTSAEQYHLMPIFIKKKSLPFLDRNEYFIQDLLDLKVKFQNNEIGFISNVISAGDRDIFIIQLNNKKQHIAIPFIDRYIKTIDLVAGFINVSNIDELF